MGGEDLGDIPACLGRRPGAGESTLNRRPRKGDQEATALRSTHNQKICRTKTMIINGSGQDPPYRGKLEHAPLVSKRLNKIRFSAGSGIARSGRLFFIDGKLTSGQTRGGRNEKHFSGLKTKIAREAADGKEHSSG